MDKFDFIFPQKLKFQKQLSDRLLRRHYANLAHI